MSCIVHWWNDSTVKLGYFCFAVQTPQQAVNLISNVVNRVRSGESPNLRQSLIHFRKDRKTIICFKYIYYVSKINEPLLNEVSKQKLVLDLTQHWSVNEEQPTFICIVTHSFLALMFWFGECETKNASEFLPQDRMCKPKYFLENLCQLLCLISEAIKLKLVLAPTNETKTHQETSPCLTAKNGHVHFL